MTPVSQQLPEHLVLKTGSHEEESRFNVHPATISRIARHEEESRFNVHPATISRIARREWRTEVT